MTDSPVTGLLQESFYHEIQTETFPDIQALGSESFVPEHVSQYP